MQLPVFFAVGETFSSLDIASRYNEYQVINCLRGDQALGLIAQFKQLQVPVILLMVDQNLPDMKGISFLAQAKQIVSAKCLVVADADKEAEPLGSQHFRVDAVVKKCHPPEEFFFPILDELIVDQSRQLQEALLHEIQVIGHRWSAASHQAKDFLARHSIPFEWRDLETHPEDLQRFKEGDENRWPIIQFPDGSHLAQPSNTQIAEKIGLLAEASEMPFYDLVIVGAGPAGLAAAVYGASEGLRTAVIERDAPGGQAGMSSRIENYLGFPTGLAGAELASRGVAQAARLGAHLLTPQEVISIREKKPYHYLRLSDGREVGCYAALLATGVAYRSLAVPGVDRLFGAGVYYGAAMTEATSYKDRQVYIVGGANSSGQAALYFADYARQVTLLVRGESLEASMSSYLIEEIKGRDNIFVQTHSEVIECLGGESLETLCIMHKESATKEYVSADGLFVFIGAAPHTKWLPESLLCDQAGFILTGAELRNNDTWELSREPMPLESSIPGIFVAGDVRAGSIKRVASAVGEGAGAISSIHQYLRLCARE